MDAALRAADTMRASAKREGGDPKTTNETDESKAEDLRMMRNAGA